MFWLLVLTGLGLALGIQTRLLGLAMAMARFSLFSGPIAYGDLTEPTDRVMLLKNIALTGGIPFVALHGPGAWSLDTAMARHKARLAG